MYTLNHNRMALNTGHGTVDRGHGHVQPSVSYDPHQLQGEQEIVQQQCDVSINPFIPNPFITTDKRNTWNDNYLILKDPKLRTLASVAPLDRGFASSSKYISSLHQQPCYTDYKVKYTSNGEPVPKAGYPHS